MLHRKRPSYAHLQKDDPVVVQLDDSSLRLNGTLVGIVESGDDQEPNAYVNLTGVHKTMTKFRAAQVGLNLSLA